jgi:hypothetical protein
MAKWHGLLVNSFSAWRCGDLFDTGFSFVDLIAFNRHV